MLKLHVETEEHNYSKQLVTYNNSNNGTSRMRNISTSSTGTIIQTTTRRRRCIRISTAMCYTTTTTTTIVQTVVVVFMLLLLLFSMTTIPVTIAFQSIITPVKNIFKNTISTSINSQCTTNTGITGIFQSSHQFGLYLSSSSIADESNDSSFLSSSSTTKKITDEKVEVQDNTKSSYTVQTNDRIILFDGVCNFCNRWVDILLRIDVNGIYKFTPLQSNVGKSLLVSIGKDQDDMSSIVLIQPKKKNQQSSTSSNNNNIQYDYYTKSDCVVEVVKQLGVPGLVFGTIVSTIIPKQLQDTIYDTVSENRYNLLGKRDICRSGDPQYFDRFIS